MSGSYTTTLRCAEPGCSNSTVFVSSSKRERAETERRYLASPWRCTKHANPGRVLRPDNSQLEWTLVAGRVGDLPDRYWVGPGGRAGSGFVSGPGFCAHADDFPEGARLVVTARVEIPREDIPDEAPPSGGESR